MRFHVERQNTLFFVYYDAHLDAIKVLEHKNILIYCIGGGSFSQGTRRSFTILLYST